MDLKGRHFLTLKDFTPEETTYHIDLSAEVKAKKKAFKKVTYKSSNAKVATVSKKGIVKGKKVGTTTIKVVSVKNKKKTASIKVKVVKNAVKKVTLNKKNLDLAVGASEKLSAKVNAPKKSYKAVKWTSSNEKVVKVQIRVLLVQ